ncbi:hypothetical protein V8G54_001296 [Vigna mungo]|uniref:Uncharacterized protein n=1 Tax=Vigna mungo TaxID=3915 RepID=A0AAQ3P8G9_VIGMU
MLIRAFVSMALSERSSKFKQFQKTTFFLFSFHCSAIEGNFTLSNDTHSRQSSVSIDGGSSGRELRFLQCRRSRCCNLLRSFMLAGKLSMEENARFKSSSLL